MRHESATACVLLIGNEILSGKTQDRNLAFLGSELGRLGVQLREARVLPDDKAEIVAALNQCRARYTYVITTGGIGPTHDDITAECVAGALERDLVLDPDAVARLRRSGRELNAARLKMAHVPQGATLIDNPLSPRARVSGGQCVRARRYSQRGARHVRHLRGAAGGRRVDSRQSRGRVPARRRHRPSRLETIAATYPEVDIGSYPFARDGRYGANLVVRGMDESVVEAVFGRVVTAMRALGGESSVREPA